MSFVKYANAEILEVKTSKTRIPFEYGSEPGSTFQKFAALEDTGDNDGYLYIRTRAISSRVNKNNDGWPSEELAKGYKTFVGRPLFVDHNNDDPKRTRGVILDARLFVDEEKTSALDPYYASAPPAHLPPTHIETISEMDARTFPKLAEAIRTGKIDSVSMGANIEKSVCSVCDNYATTPKQYCSHIKAKGNEFEVTSADGSVSKRKAYEDCHGVNFFEQSFVFDPADETALFNDKSDKKMKFAKQQTMEKALNPEGMGIKIHQPNITSSNTSVKQKEIKTAAGLKTDVNQPGDEGPNDKIKNEFPKSHKPQSESVTAPERVDTLSNDLICPNCESDNLAEDPDTIWRCPTCEYELPPEEFRAPDLEEAREMDTRQKVDEKVNQDGEMEIKTEEDDGSDEGVTFADDKKKDKKLQGVSPVAPISKTIKNNNSNRIINEMKWKTEPKNVEFVGSFLSHLSKTASAEVLESEQRVARLLLRAYGAKRLSSHNITSLEIAEAIERYSDEKDFEVKTAASATVTIPANGIHIDSIGLFKGLGLSGSATYHNVPEAMATQFQSLPPEAGVTNVSGTDVTVNINTVYKMLPQGIGNELAKAAGENYQTFQIQVDLDISGDEKDLAVAQDLFETKGDSPKWVQVGQLLEAGNQEEAKQLAYGGDGGVAAVSATRPQRKVLTPKPQVKKDEKIVSDQLKPVEADRRVIKREESESDDGGVKRTETIIDEVGEIGSMSDEPKAEETTEEPKAEETNEEPKAQSESEDKDESRPWEKKEEREPAYASTKRESKLLLAMETAKLASSLGIIPNKEELNYAAELEGKSEDVIRDRKEVLEGIKSSGVLNKTARFREVPSAPRLASSNGGRTEDKPDVVDYLSQVFL